MQEILLIGGPKNGTRLAIPDMNFGRPLLFPILSDLPIWWYAEAEDHQATVIRQVEYRPFRIGTKVQVYVIQGMSSSEAVDKLIANYGIKLKEQE